MRFFIHLCKRTPISGHKELPSMNERERYNSTQSDSDDDSKLIADPQSASTGRGCFSAFVSSGLFFMLFGSLMLFFAYSTMSSTHSSFTFVLVVVGVAILLYGTGTQGAGEFGGKQGGNRYKATIAGGAGVLALAIGIGMVVKHTDIREAFQVEQKYLRFPLYASNDGITNLANYAAIATVNGINVPTALRGDRIEIYVPYIAGQKADTVLEVSGVLYRREPAPKQKASVPFSEKITFSQNSRHLVIEGSVDFPRWEGDKKSEISVSEIESVDLAATDMQQIVAKGQQRKNSDSASPPPLLIEVQ